MADKKISELTELVVPNGAVDIAPVMDTSTNKTKKAFLSKLPISDSAINHSFPFTTDITSNTATTQNLTSLSSSSGFNSNTNLTSIYVGTAVTSIGDNTFKDCTNLIDVTLTPGVASIGIRAFQGCSSLSGITIPDSVTSIENDAFRDCTSLTSITIPNSVTSLESFVFFGCDSLASAILSDNVTIIRSGTFSSCSSLTSINIPDGVTEIQTLAFFGCAFTSITIPKGVTLIGNEAFQNCTSLSVINSLATSAPTLGTNVFDNIPATQINVPAGATASYQSAGDGTTYGGLTIVEV